MIAAKSKSTVDSTFTLGQEFQASIDEADLPHIFGLFTDLYKNKVRAIVREYSANALDAQVEAGYTGPIEIKLPTVMDQTFTVQDHGTGLSADEIGTIYSRYGRSTKRSTNDAIGMLGLGCKSALTYVPQFTVSSVKGGLRTEVLVTRQPNGVPTFRAMPSTKTDQANGTKVTVAVERYDIDRFRRECEWVFRFWAPGTVKVNGSEPTKITGLKVSDTLTIIDERECDYVVMGNVAYPHNLPHSLPYGKKLVARIPIGAADVPPARESLQESAATNAVLKGILDTLQRDLAAAVSAKVAAAQTPREALIALADNSTLLNSQGLAQVKWNGRHIPRQIEFVDKKGETTGLYSRPMNATRRREGIDYGEAPMTLLIHGYELSNFTANHKRKIVKYVEDKGLDYRHAALTAAKPDTSWLDASQVVEWDTINAIKLPRAINTRNGTRITGSYDCYIDGDSKAGLPAADFNLDNPVYFFWGPMWNARNYSAIFHTEHPDGYTLVCMPENRLAKFKRDFPQATEVKEAVKTLWTAWVARLTDRQRLALTMHDSGQWDDYYQLGEKSIKFGITLKDPKLRENIATTRAMKADLDRLITERQRFQGQHGNHVPASWSDPLADGSYPMYDYYGMRRGNALDTLLYLNARYEYDQANTTPTN